MPGLIDYVLTLAEDDMEDNDNVYDLLWLYTLANAVTNQTIITGSISSLH